MAKKKAVTEPAPASNQAQVEGKSKIALGVELIKEWEAKGKDTRSSQGLLSELQSRHSDRKWSIADITNAKGKLRDKGGKPSNGRKKRQVSQEPKPAPAAPRVQSGGDVTVSDLLAVKKLAEQVGGLDKLQQAIQALTAILGTE